MQNLKESIANISHNLRIPPTSIQWYLTLLDECSDKDREHYKKVCYLYLIAYFFVVLKLMLK